MANAQDITKFQVKQPNGVTRYSEPLISPDKALGENGIFTPSVLVVGGSLAMLNRVEAKGVHGAGVQLRFSEDGRTFVPYASNPVLAADSPFDKGGCEDPRVVQISGTYYMTYVGSIGGRNSRQCLATSTDLIHWEKKGIILAPEGWNKGEVKGAIIVPEKIGGKYVMYFRGGKVTWDWQAALGMAVSDDLLHWTQPLDHPIMTARTGHFDSFGLEPGPTPIVIPEGILLIYNGWDAGHVYKKTGWVLISRNDPSKILKRCETPFIEPQFKYDMEHCHDFTEGAVWFKGLWRFYYTASNKYIGLAELDDISAFLKAVP